MKAGYAYRGSFLRKCWGKLFQDPCTLGVPFDCNAAAVLVEKRQEWDGGRSMAPSTIREEFENIKLECWENS